MSARRLRVGIAGLGRAFSITLPALAAHGRVVVVAGADHRPEARGRFATDFNARTYATVPELCADDAVEAVYIATPHQCHLPDVLAAAAHGRHVLVEKPMALTLEDCRAMVNACRDAGVTLIVGHSHSFDAPVVHAHRLIAGGSFGALRMITAMNYTDFLYRPRRPEELDTAQGGGVIFNQAPHQVDVVRLLGGGRVKSVSAICGAWDAARPTEGAYQALLHFETGAVASLIYSGFGHFDTDELCDWIAESGWAKSPADYGAARHLLNRLAVPSDEVAAKSNRNYGGEQYAGPAPGNDQSGRVHQHFGLVIASCDRADLRPTAKGVHVYGDVEKSFEAISPSPVFRSEVLDELTAAVLDEKPPLHSGEWGLATMEVCLGLLRSSREQRSIEMSCQIAPAALAAELATA